MVLLATPYLGQELLNTTVGLVDTFLAGQISVEATGAVGIAAYVAWLAVMLFGLVATGTTALVSRSIGAGDVRAGNRIANQSLVMALIVGIGGAVLMYGLAPVFAKSQGMSGTSYDIVVRYLRFEAIGYLPNSITVAACAALRGAGNTRTPMKVLGTVNILNMVVSPALVFGFGPLSAWGVDGIVAGTVAARFSGCAIILVLLLRGRSGIRIDRSVWGLHVEPVRRVLRIGLPAMSDGAVMWVGHFVFLSLIKRLAEGPESDVIYAAHMIVIRLEALIYLPASAWAAACAAIIGQSLGADDSTRAKRTGHEGVVQCVLLASLIAVIFFCAAGPIFGLMHTDSAVRLTGVRTLRLAALFEPALAASIVYVGALRGAGETRSPLVITVIVLLLVRLPLGCFFGFTLGYGLMGMWVGICSDRVIRVLAVFVVYVRGRWLRTAV